MSLAEMTVGSQTAPHIVFTVEGLLEIIEAVDAVGEFCFDVETRGVVERHPDVMDLIEKEWQAHAATLKATSPDILRRSREIIVNSWRKTLALDPLRNEVIWLGIATTGKSWVIPMGHPNGEVLDPAVHGDGTTVPPPGFRKLLKSGAESMARAKFFRPATFSEAPQQLSKAEVFTTLRPLFMGDHVKIGHNVKFDARSIRKYLGGDLAAGPFADTMIAQHVLNENLLSYRLDGLIELNFEGHKAYHREGKLGAIITDTPFTAAARYLHLDVRWTWQLYRSQYRRIKASPALLGCFNQDMAVLRVLMAMEDNGIPVNQRAMTKLGKQLDQRLNELLLDMHQYAPPGFNPSSTKHKQELLFSGKRAGGLGLKPGKKTDKGAASVDESTLRRLESKHPVIPMLLEWSETKKLVSTYVDGLLPQLVHGRLHPSFNLHRTATGRLSACVSGDTLLTTSRGVYRFDEYFPRVGDLVPTHTGQWKQVVQKIYKGEQPMVSVRLSNGSVLKCTEEHRILTPSGWSTVGDLVTGAEVYSHVGIKEVYGEYTEHSGSPGSVPGRRDQANHRFNSGVSGHDVSQRTAHREDARSRRDAEAGAGAALLPVEDVREEPDAGQVWRAASQLHRAGGGRSRLSDAEGSWEVCIRASSGAGRGSWFERASRWLRRTPHQRGQTGQSSGQSGVGNFLGASGAACEVVTVTEIVPVGTLGVWDIEVEGDHSYVTHGFVNHNSNPNLQNIPRDSSVRGLFVAPDGYELLVADYDQIELRVMCMFSQDKQMSHYFLNGIDIHTGAAATILRKPLEEVTGEERQMGKMVNFLTAFGGGAANLAEKTGIPEPQAEEFIKGYYKGFAGITAWKQQVIADGYRTGYVSTMSGRRRRLPDLKSNDRLPRMRAERQAVNAVVQGSAADLCKLAMIDCFNVFEHSPAQMLVQVHDEIVVAVPAEDVDEMKDMLVTAMGHGKIYDGIPLKVSCHAALSWAEGKGAK